MNDKNAIETAVVESFSEMAFIDVAFTQECVEESQISHILFLSFSEPEAGYISLYLSTECKKKIVENIYGKDWAELQDEDIDDCLLELVNVLAGRYLKFSYGEEAKHSMSLPQLLFDETELPEYKDNGIFYFSAEEVPFKVGIGTGRK
jgi:hypothetical protein